MHDKPRKYFGCPMINGRVDKLIFNELLEKTNQQLSKWKANSISQAGRTVFINANMSVKPNFIMQSFILPVKVHKELDRTNRCSFWNKEPNYSPLIGWDKIYKPEKYGGIDIRKVAEIHKVMQMKLL